MPASPSGTTVCIFLAKTFSLNILIHYQVGKAAGPRSSGAGVRQRKSTAPTPRSRPDVWRFYTEDSPVLKAGLVPVFVMSLIFIASVSILHIWGKYKK